jgi:membrane fusion protein, copper/silver efflux system
MKKLLALAPLLLVLAGLLTSCKRETSIADPNVAYYTCTMHPSVRSHDPKGKCPICGMNLVPVMKKGAQTNAATVGTEKTEKITTASLKNAEVSEFTVAPERQQMIGVTYTNAVTKPVRQTIRAVGSDQTGAPNHPRCRYCLV